jgi:hypothetical protein
MWIQFACTPVDDCMHRIASWPAPLELSEGIVHTVLIISLLFLQERFLVRSDNLDEFGQTQCDCAVNFFCDVAY